MRLPRYLLRHEASVESYSGEGSTGPEYGAATTVRGQWEGKTRVVRSPEGLEVTSTATFVVDIDAALSRLDRVTKDGTTYRVVEVIRHDADYLTTPPHLEVLLSPIGRTPGNR